MIETKRVIYFGLETNQNFDPGLVAANAILVGDPKTNYAESERMHERNVVKQTAGKLQSVYGGSLGSISFNVEIKGIDGSPGTAIEIAPILKAIGFAEVLIPATSSVYTGPITSNIPTATIYDFHDGTLTILTGAVAQSAKITGEGIGKLEVTFVGHMVQWGTATAGAASTITLDANSSAVDDTGIGQTIKIIRGTGIDQVRTITDYVGSTKVATVNGAWVTQPDATSVYTISGDLFDKAIPSPAYEATVPAPIKRTNFTIGSYGPVVTKFEVDLGLEAAMNDSISSPDGFAHPLITDSEVTASFDPDKTVVATKDWLAEHRAGTVQAFSTGTIGETAGNKWGLAMAKIYSNAAPSNSDSNKISKFEVQVSALETSGDDRCVLTFL